MYVLPRSACWSVRNYISCDGEGLCISVCPGEKRLLDALAWRSVTSPAVASRFEVTLAKTRTGMLSASEAHLKA